MMLDDLLIIETARMYEVDPIEIVAYREKFVPVVEEIMAPVEALPTRDRSRLREASMEVSSLVGAFTAALDVPPVIKNFEITMDFYRDIVAAVLKFHKSLSSDGEGENAEG